MSWGWSRPSTDAVWKYAAMSKFIPLMPPLYPARTMRCLHGALLISGGYSLVTSAGIPLLRASHIMERIPWSSDSAR